MRLTANYKSILKIALPLLMFQLVQNIIGFTDTVFLGRVGVVEFNACGITSMFYLVLMMMGYGVSRGAQIIIARRAGEEDYNKLGRAFDHLLIVEGALATALFLFLYYFAGQLLPWFIQSPDILAAGEEYLYYRSWGIFFSLWGFVMLALYAGVGRTQVIFYITLLMAVVNIFLNYSLIFGHFGFPEMGIGGAGLASTISEGVSGLFGLIFLIFDPLRKKIKLFRFGRVRWHLIQKMIRLSMPLVLQFMFGLGGWFLFFTFIENMGPTPLAVSIVIKWIYQFFSIGSWSVASSINSIASNLVGQRKFKATLLSIRKSVIVSVGFTLVLLLILFLFPDYLTSIFTDDMTIITASRQLIPILGLIILMMSVSVIIFNGIVGVGATHVSLLYEVIAVVIYISYAYWVVNIMEGSLILVWCAEFIYWTILFVFSLYYLLKGKWKKLKL